MAGLYSEKDVKLAKKYFKESSKMGFSPSSNCLSIIYMDEKKYDKCMRHTKLAIENGCDQAVYNLGYIYEKCGIYIFFFKNNFTFFHIINFFIFFFFF